MDLNPGTYDFVIYRPLFSRLLHQNRIVLKFEPHQESSFNINNLGIEFRFILPSHTRMAFGQKTITAGEFLVEDVFKNNALESITKDRSIQITELSNRSGHYITTSPTLNAAEKIMRILKMPIVSDPTKRGPEGIRR